MWNRSPFKSFLSTLKVSQWGRLLRGVGVFPLGSDLGRVVFLGSLSGWKIAVKGSLGSLSEGCGIKGERATSWSCAATKLKGFCSAQLCA